MNKTWVLKSILTQKFPRKNGYSPEFWTRPVYEHELQSIHVLEKKTIKKENENNCMLLFYKILPRTQINKYVMCFLGANVMWFSVIILGSM